MRHARQLGAVLVVVAMMGVAASTAPVAATTGPPVAPWAVVGGFPTPDGIGFWLTFADGSVEEFGEARHHGDASALALAGPIVGGAATPTGEGYWLVAADGGIFSFGDAEFHGSMARTALAAPVFTLAVTPSGQGYWLVATDGGIFSFGDAEFHGSTGALTLAAEIVGASSDLAGEGYRFVAGDGGVFSFGDVEFHGSLPGRGEARRDVIGLAPTPRDTGYWIARRDGTVTSFGDAPPSPGTQPPACDAVAAIITNPVAYGYRLVLESSKTLAFGDAPGDDLDTGGPFCPYERLRRQPTDDQPLRVLVYGDSQAFSLIRALTPRQLDSEVDWIGYTPMGMALGADRRGVFGFEELPAFYPRWRESIDALISVADPDVVVVLIGAMDVIPRLDPDGILIPGSPRWDAWYAGVLDDAADRLAAGGARLTWIGLPCFDSAYASQVRIVDAQLRALSRRNPSVGYVDLDAVACPGGAFREFLPGRDGAPLRARQPDGVHFEAGNAAELFESFFATAYSTDWSS